MEETRRQRREERKAYINSKKDIPCDDCGRRFPHYCMDFHHLIEETKRPSIGRKGFAEMLSKCSIKTIDEEIAKCVVVCACCHRIRHHS